MLIYFHICIYTIKKKYIYSGKFKLDLPDGKYAETMEKSREPAFTPTLSYKNKKNK